jgi:predicted ATPase
MRLCDILSGLSSFAQNRREFQTSRELSEQSLTLARALLYAARLHQLRREGWATQERAAALVELATEQGFAQWMGAGTFLGGWAIAAQGQHEAGLAQMHQGLAAAQAAGEVVRSRFARLAAAYGENGQAEAGLRLLAEAPVDMLLLPNNAGRVFIIS